MLEFPRFTYKPSQSGSTVDEIIQVQLDRSYLLYVKDAADDGVCCSAGLGAGVSIFLGREAGNTENLLALLPGEFGSDEIRVFTAGVEGILVPGTFPTVSPTATAEPTSGTVDILMEITLDADPVSYAGRLSSYCAADTFSPTASSYSCTIVESSLGNFRGISAWL